MVNWTGNQFSTLPEVAHRQPDRRSAYGKQVAGGEGLETSEPHVHKEAIWIYNPNEQPIDQPTDQPEKPEQHTVARRRPRRRLLWISIGLTLLVVLGIGLGIGLTTALKSPASSNHVSNTTGSNASTPTSAGDSTPSEGAMERSGLATCLLHASSHLAWPSQLQSNQTSLLLFYQHTDGELRVMQNVLPGSWTGGSSKELIATDAKNGTPIAVHCPQPGIAGNLHVFYISEDNYLRQRSMDNLTYVWSDGLINSLNIKTLDSDPVGLTAGFYAGPIGDVNLEGTEAFSGIRLLVSTSKTTFNQYSWRPGLPQWHYEQNWPDMNGEATPATFAWGKGHTTYINFIDSQNNAVVYWEDTAMKKPSTDTHRINVWTKSSIEIPNLDPTAGLDFHGNLFGRVADSGKIQSWNMTYQAENSTIGSTMLSEVGGPPGIPGTRVVAITPPLITTGGLQNIFVFYQANVNEIVMSEGSVATGRWNSTTLPVPDA